MSEILTFPGSKLKSFYNDKYDSLYLIFSSEVHTDIQVKFKEPLYFTYKSSEGGARISIVEERKAMHDILLSHYIQIPGVHPFNFYRICDDTKKVYIEIVAQDISVKNIN